MCNTDFCGYVGTEHYFVMELGSFQLGMFVTPGVPNWPSVDRPKARS